MEVSVIVEYVYLVVLSSSVDGYKVWCYDTETEQLVGYDTISLTAYEDSQRDGIQRTVALKQRYLAPPIPTP